MAEHHHSLRVPIRRGLLGRCPRCGDGALFAGFLKVAPRCGRCGLDFSFADAADGPAFFVMSFSGFLVVFLALAVEVLFQPPYWLHALIWGTLAVLLPLVLLRSFKGVLIALQFRHKAEEGKLASE